VTQRPCGRDRGVTAQVVAMDSGRRHAHELRRAQRTITHEDVHVTVRVARHKSWHRSGTRRTSHPPTRPGSSFRCLPCTPAESTLTRVVWPLARSRTKTSVDALVSPGTSVDANEANTTTRPSAEMLDDLLSASPCVPEVAVLARCVPWASALAVRRRERPSAWNAPSA